MNWAGNTVYQLSNLLFTSMSKEKLTRKVWSKEDTLLLLKCYGERKEEFKHARKRKVAYDNVLEDMFFQGFQDTSVNAKSLESKMRTLTKAYKSAKDNERQTGAAPCTVPYLREMDEIFGETSLVTNNHTVTFGVEENYHMHEVSPNESSAVHSLVEEDEEVEWLIEACDNIGSSSSTQVQMATPTPSSSRSASMSSTVTSNSHSTDHTPAATRIRKSARERYFEKKKN